MFHSRKIAIVLILTSLHLATFLVRTIAASDTWFVRNDPAWVDQLSQPQHDIIFEHDIKVRMRDGVRLSANIWRPKAEGKFPVIFVYMPYDNSRTSDSFRAILSVTPSTSFPAATSSPAST